MDRNESLRMSETENENYEKFSVDVSTFSMTNIFAKSKTLRIFLAVFNIIGVKIDLKSAKRNACTLFVKWIYLFLLLVIALLNCSLQMYTLRFQKKFESAMWSVGFLEHYILLSVIYVAMFRESEVIQFVNQLFRSLSRYCKENVTAITSVKKIIPLCLTIGFFDLIYESVYYVRNTLWLTLYNPDPWETEYFFGIRIKNLLVENIVMNLDSVCFILQIFISDLFCSFLIFVLYLIIKCYRYLNEGFESEKSPKQFITEHLNMANNVTRFNQIMSPAILIVTTIHMFTIVTTAYELIFILKKLEYPVDFILERILQFVKVVLQFIIFCKLGFDIQCLSQKAISILLHAKIAGKTDTGFEIYDNSFKDSSLMNLFTSQLATSPVIVCASNLIVIEYKLITIVISIAITYITIISSMESKKDLLSTEVTNFTNTSIDNYINYFNETTNLTNINQIQL